MKRFGRGTRIPLIIGVLGAGAVLVVAFLVFRTLSAERREAEAATAFAKLAVNVEETYQSEPESVPAAGAVRIPIIIYHSVRPDSQNRTKEEAAYSVTPEVLESELAYLKDNGYTAISMDQFVDFVENGTSTVPKPVVLAFDDGWRNQYTYAFPLLKKYGLKAIFYVYTNPIDHGKEHFLSWDEIKDMSEAGMEIGAHTITHPLFRYLTADHIYAEMAGGKRILEAHLGKEVRHFASPFGSTSKIIQDAAKKAGFVTARTTYRGVYHSPDDIMRLRAVLVGPSLKSFIGILKTE